MKNLLFIFLLGCSLTIAAQIPKRLYTQSDNEKMLKLLDSTQRELLRVVHSLSDTQFYFHIDKETWSANDIAEHIGLVDEGYLRELWFCLAQPAFPESYADSTKGGDEKALAYATEPEKTKARGTNLPRNRFCNKETCVRIFTETNDMAIDFFTKNASADLRRFYIFRNDNKGGRNIKDAYQFGLLLVAHRIRHTNQLKKIIADSRFPK